jgi:hypothetical protein
VHTGDACTKQTTSKSTNFKQARMKKQIQEKAGLKHEIVLCKGNNPWAALVLYNLKNMNVGSKDHIVHAGIVCGFRQQCLHKKFTLPTNGNNNGPSI